MSFRSGLLFAAVISLSLNSCRDKGGINIDQGEIHYTIEYKGDVSSMKELMPKNLIVYFKDDKTLMEMSTFGNSGILNLSNPEDKIFDTYISLMTIRYFYVGEPGEIYPGFEAMKDIEIRKTSRSAIICGFNCKNAEVTLAGNKSNTYEIWYTNEIKIKEPNATTPFKDIDGVLMKFFFLVGTSEMHFTAETVFKKDIPDKTFDRREKYIRISRDKIDEFIKKFINP